MTAVAWVRVYRGLSPDEPTDTRAVTAYKAYVESHAGPDGGALLVEVQREINRLARGPKRGLVGGLERPLLAVRNQSDGVLYFTVAGAT